MAWDGPDQTTVVVTTRRGCGSEWTRKHAPRRSPLTDTVPSWEQHKMTMIIEGCAQHLWELPRLTANRLDLWWKQRPPA